MAHVLHRGIVVVTGKAQHECTRLHHQQRRYFVLNTTNLVNVALNVSIQDEDCHGLP